MADSLMKRYNLADEDCKRQISDIHLEKISQAHCKDWRRLPPYLELNRAMSDDIDHDSGKEKAKRYEFFTEWKDEKGADATYNRLVHALVEINSMSDAEYVCQLIPKLTEPSNKLSTATPSATPTQKPPPRTDEVDPDVQLSLDMNTG